MYTYTHVYPQTHAGVLVSGVHSKGDNNQIVEGVNAAVTILEIVSGIFLPGLPYVHPTIRIGLHTGEGVGVVTGCQGAWPLGEGAWLLGVRGRGRWVTGGVVTRCHPITMVSGQVNTGVFACREMLTIKKYCI